MMINKMSLQSLLIESVSIEDYWRSHSHDTAAQRVDVCGFSAF